MKPKPADLAHLRAAKYFSKRKTITLYLTVWGEVLGGVESAILEELEKQKNPNYRAKFGKQPVLEITGPIVMSRRMYPISTQYSHLLLRSSGDFGWTYDRWKHHAKKQSQAGLGMRYSKLKDAIVRRPASKGSVLTYSSGGAAPWNSANGKMKEGVAALLFRYYLFLRAQGW